MKTKRAMKPYDCFLCKKKINKGEQYARKSVVLGKTTIWAHGDPVPDWAWDEYRSAEPVCNACANPKQKEEK
jgi:hypothetical protein